MDPDTFLPRSLRIEATEENAEKVPSVNAHLMPFSIDFNGPAPVQTYFVTHPVHDPSDDPTSHNENELTASFRGRRIHAIKMPLPKNYRLDFFRVEEDKSTPRSTRRTSSAPKPVSQPIRNVSSHAPVRGSRFTLDDEDEDKDEEMTCMTAIRDEFSAIPDEDDIPSTFLHEADSSTTVLNPTHVLRPAYMCGASVWIWGPDGPVDGGYDPFILTCQDWVEQVAPLVRISSMF